MHKLLWSHETKEYLIRGRRETQCCCTYAKGEPASSLRSWSGGKNRKGWVKDSTSVVGWIEWAEESGWKAQRTPMHRHRKQRKAKHYWKYPICSSVGFKRPYYTLGGFPSSSVSYKSFLLQQMSPNLKTPHQKELFPHTEDTSHELLEHLVWSPIFAFVTYSHQYICTLLAWRLLEKYSSNV